MRVLCLNNVTDERERVIDGTPRELVKRVIREEAARLLLQILDERNNLWTAQDHRLVIRPIRGAGNGLVISETCTSWPCPWLSDGSDTKDLFTINAYDPT